MVLSPDGRTCITCGGGFEACVWDLSKGTLLRCLQGHSSWVVDVAVSPDACRAATASHDGRIMCVQPHAACVCMCVFVYACVYVYVYVLHCFFVHVRRVENKSKKRTVLPSGCGTCGVVLVSM